MQNPQITIIVPVYNAEMYLHKCIDSILSQSFTDYELLLIDDGSKDKSGAICDEYVVTDARIRVFHKENGGVSSARNLGLDNAQGKWIYFVDADDEVLPNGLKTLFHLATNDVDLVFAGYEKFDRKNCRIFSINQDAQYQLSQTDTIEYVYCAPLYGYMGYLWCKLFRKSIIDERILRFNEKIYFNEDRLFIIQYVCASCKLCNVTTHAVYKYIVREKSVMTQLSILYNPQFATDLDAEIQMAKCITEHHFSNKVQKMAREGVVTSYNRVRSHMKKTHCYSIKSIISLTRKIGCKNYVEYIKMKIIWINKKINKILCKNFFLL